VAVLVTVHFVISSSPRHYDAAGISCNLFVFQHLAKWRVLYIEATAPNLVLRISRDPQFEAGACFLITF